jgi:hypothetical protein
MRWRSYFYFVFWPLVFGATGWKFLSVGVRERSWLQITMGVLQFFCAIAMPVKQAITKPNLGSTNATS